MTPRSRAPAPAAVPTFLLYEDGLGGPDADPDFIHIETIRARAGLHNWEIRPHRHQALHQFLILLQGQGTLDAEGQIQPLAAPSLAVVPSGLAHGFAFSPDADGFVLTVADGFLERCRERAPDSLATPTAVAALALDDGAQTALLKAVFAFLEGELAWSRRGRERATAAALDLILVALARGLADADMVEQASRAQVLAGRFRALVNDHFAEDWPLARYAQALGVSVDQLKRSCRTAARRSPLRIIHQRLLSEAKRDLIYTSMTVQEIAFALGFSDPAYFTRFFTRAEGRSPRSFRSAPGAG